MIHACLYNTQVQFFKQLKQVRQLFFSCKTCERYAIKKIPEICGKYGVRAKHNTIAYDLLLYFQNTWTKKANYHQGRAINLQTQLSKQE